jgi:TatD DNase family protein
MTAAFPLIDIGVNMTNKRFHNDLDEVIARAQAEGIIHMVVTGTSVEESRAAAVLAQQYRSCLSSTAGVHPHNAREWSAACEAELRELHLDESVVAVGECGLDFNRDFSPRDQQEKAFAAQLELAVRLNKPVFLHERDAHQRFFAILKEYRDQLPNAVVHCFTGTKKEAFAYLDLDCHLGITGWLCDERRADDLREAVPHVPLDRLMLETDAPYLVPRTLRPRPKRNEPAYLPEVLRALASVAGKPVEEVASQTLSNTQRFFGLRAESEV